MSYNPYLDRHKKNCHGTRAEKKTAYRLGGRTTPASGAKEHSKGDFVAGNMLFENKSTVNKSLSLKLDWLTKITDEATDKGMMPALAIQFVESNGGAKNKGAWVMVREVDFQELLESGTKE